MTGLGKQMNMRRFLRLIILTVICFGVSLQGAEALNRLRQEKSRITMDEFCNMSEAQRYRQTVEVSSAADMKKLRTYLQEEPDGGNNIFYQTQDICISPYTYEYLSANGRIAIRYQGITEAYYDMRSDAYYADLTTGTAISYKWKADSFAPIGSSAQDGKEGKWSYQGNGYAIEGIYQRSDKRSVIKNSGIFCNAGRVSGVYIKNYFGYGKNIEDLGVLGDDIRSVEQCGGENIELIMHHNGGLVTVGFVACAAGDIADTSVSADIFVDYPKWDGKEQTFGDVDIGIIAGDSRKFSISGCSSSGNIVHWNEDLGAIGGIAGAAKNVKNCKSDAVIRGTGCYVGGIAAYMEGDIEKCFSTADINGSFRCSGGVIGDYYNGREVEGCRFDGNIRLEAGSQKYINGHISGGIVGTTRFATLLINDCQNSGNITGGSGRIGGIAGMLVCGEIVNCINAGQIKSGILEKSDGGEDEDSYAGGIVGMMCDNENSVLNCINEGRIYNENGYAGEITGCMNGDTSEVCNVYMAGVATGSAIGQSGIGCGTGENIENCLAGQGEEIDDLCQTFNQWIREFDISVRYHFVISEKGDKFLGWIVKNGKLTLEERSEAEPSEKPETTKRPAVSTKPSATAGPDGTGKLPTTDIPKKTEDPLPTATEAPGRTQEPLPTATAEPERTQEPLPTATAEPERAQKPLPTATAEPERTQEPLPTATAEPERTQEPLPTATAEPEKTQDPIPPATLMPDRTRTPAITDEAAQTQKPEQPEVTEKPGKMSVPEKKGKTAGTKTSDQAKKKKAKAPSFKLQAKRNRRKQKYVLMTLKSCQGTYIEVQAGLKKNKFHRMKLKENRIKKLHGRIRFGYSFSGKRIYFKIRTYEIKKGKRIYSRSSKVKSIRIR